MPHHNDTALLHGGASTAAMRAANRYPSRAEPRSVREAGACVCPVCQGEVYRVRRRTIDRLTSKFASTRRFRCNGFGCRWEGNLRVGRDLADRGRTPVPRVFVMEMGVAAVALVALVGLGFNEAMRDPAAFQPTALQERQARVVAVSPTETGPSAPR